MTCDLCGDKEATVHLTEIINEQTRELHLCEPCARERGEKASSDFGLADLLSGLSESTPKPAPESRKKLVCAECGMTYEEFRKSGRLGCGSCYESFQRVLAPLLKRIHGATQHVGKSPAVGKAKVPAHAHEELSKLRERLKKAIASEQFEEAVELRDKIRSLETKAKRARSRK